VIRFVFGKPMKGLRLKRFKFESGLRLLVLHAIKRPGLLCMGLVGLGLVTFLSLRSSPALATVHWMPGTIARWADTHGRFCNFPAYGLLAVPFLLIASSLRQQATVVIALALLIVAFELVQLYLPRRTCDPGDIACGWAGLLAAWAGCVLFRKFTIGMRKNTPAF